MFYVAQHVLYRLKARKTAQPGESLHIVGIWRTMSVRGGRMVKKDSGDVLNVDEAARMLGISGNLVRELAARGELPGRKVGRAWRFRRSTIMRWLDETQPAPTDETGQGDV